MIHWPVKNLVKWYEHLTPGTTARRNHDDCPSGREVRRRLYVTKSDDNTRLKCYCHNCGNGTTIDIKGAVPLRAAVPTTPDVPPPLPPVWGTPDQPKLHPRHKLWLSAYGITPNDTDSVYSASDMELVFPYGPGGYQIRYFDRQPKWKTYGHPLCYLADHIVLICEDVISFGKWVQTTNNGAIALLGHRASLKTGEQECTNKADLIIVWLDNDKPSVIEAAKALAATSCSRATVLIEGGTDPKRYSKAELRKVKDVCIELVKSPPADGRPYHVLKLLPPSQGVCA